MSMKKNMIKQSKEDALETGQHNAAFTHDEVRSLNLKTKNFI